MSPTTACGVNTSDKNSKNKMKPTRVCLLYVRDGLGGNHSILSAILYQGMHKKRNRFETACDVEE